MGRRASTGEAGSLFAVDASKPGFDSELDAMFAAPQPRNLPAKSLSHVHPNSKHGGNPKLPHHNTDPLPHSEIAQDDSSSASDRDEEEHVSDHGGSSNPSTSEEQTSELDTSEDNDSAVELNDDESQQEPDTKSKPSSDNQRTSAGKQEQGALDGSWEEISDVEDMDEEQLQAFLNAKDTTGYTKLKPILENEQDSELERNQRSIFIGNVSMATTTSRALRKGLLRHLEQASPYPECTKIVSLRFRSVSFKTPTNDFSKDPEAANAATRRRERARKFRELQNGNDQSAPEPQPMLTAQQKRKIAFINHEVNERADTVNAYVRVGDPKLVHAHLEKQQKKKQPLDPRISGHVLAALMVASVNNTLFAERHLRADLVEPLTPSEIVQAGLEKVRLADGSQVGASAQADLKRTLFVGNLDFETNEEEVRSLFEKLVREERGAPPSDATSSLRLDGEAQPSWSSAEWVQSVRIIRDKATQLGKGFAYVKFLDVGCVDELLALHEAEEAFIQSKRPQVRGKPSQVAKPIQLADGEMFRRRVKLRKRALRLSRCKNTQTQPRDSRQPKRKANNAPHTPVKRRNDASRARSFGAPTPNGSSPTPRSSSELAQKASFLAKLPKDQRSLAKKNDADRQARRQQKKLSKKQAEKTAHKLGANKERVPLPQRSTAKKIAKHRK
ncbi:Nucleolar protein 12 [Malassezia yamatoensis]|uniref:Nucleolar protein 12 n=1 Tax=Malassezia yamatoensis TaxID=253288 RepID=A0AAJ6CJ52_9BASI|nr:Nucleolar protein 12 [Malassezia yamatoensis]